MSTPKDTIQGTTLIDRACREVPGFHRMYEKLSKKITIADYSKSTLINYGRAVARISLHFNKLPLALDDEQVEDYLLFLKRTHHPSKSYFKHTVYGIRFLFRLFGREDRAVRMPSVKRGKPLPVVLSKSECRRLFTAPRSLKHRVLLALIYSAGLRRREVRRLKVADIDADRMQLRVCQSKRRKDRYVVLSNYILRGLRKYWRQYRPTDWLFYGRYPGKPLSCSAIRWTLDQAVRRAGIRKSVTVHTLRHSYATHLLEDGVDIYTIKEQLGHEHINSTVIYLHVARTNRKPCHSPLDTLYNTQY